MKINVMVLDDELSARSNLRRLLSGSRVYEIVAECSDPAQALEFLAQHRVQIILSDMNMPKMSGVEFIRLARSIAPEVQMIAISGYDDYDYLRECMRVGVHDYLLKHTLTSEMLINVLDSVRQKAFPVLNEQAGEPTVQKGDVMRALFEAQTFDSAHVHTLIEQGGIFIDATCMLVIILEPDLEQQRLDYEGYLDNVGMALSDIARQVVADNYKHMEYTAGDGSVVLLLSFAKVASYQYILSVTGAAVSRIRNMARRLLGLTLSVGIGSIVQGWEEAVEQHQHLRFLMRQKLYLGAGRTYHPTDRPEAAAQPYYLSDDLTARIAFELEAGHTDDLNRLLEQALSAAALVHCERTHLTALCNRLVAIAAPAQEPSFSRFQFFDQFRACVFAAFDAALQRRREGTAYSPQVEQAVQYIEAHYAEPISLESCAESVGISYTHMSRLFSRETNQRFTEYLGRVRLKKAKALLLQGEWKMKEIVAAAGFHNYNYFFKVFKEQEGMTPNEFLAQNKKV